VKRRFRAVLAEVERSIGVLTQAAPTTRYDGRPLAEVLAGFDDGLATASEGMGSWRVPEVEDTWDACDAGIREARARCARLRSEAPQIRGFEAIIGTIDALIAPLEAFEAAAERFEDLRR
jgi:hypothetical protein